MNALSQRQFLLLLLALCGAYLGFEYWFNQYAMISVDEFWFAHRTYQYKDGLPYRDFSPYKTVLGYYILLLPMLVSSGILHTLIVMKNFIALLNAVVLLIASCWLTKYFSRTGVLCSLALLSCMEIMLTYSTNIRVDLIAYWFCLFSFLCILDRRILLAGIFIGLGFAASQKSVWFLFASNVALTLHWLANHFRRENFLNLVKFNTTAAIAIILYLGFFSLLTDWHTVLHNVFIEAAAMYHLDWYDASRKLYWQVILTLNPLPFLLAPLTLISLMTKHDQEYQQRRLVIVYALTIIGCLMPYKQVFPYYMQVTLPAFLLLYAAFFSWCISFFSSQQTFPYPARINIFLFCYSTGVIFTVVYLRLPAAYLMILVFPMLILLRTQAMIATISIVFLGLIYPGSLTIAKLIHLNGAYQKANLAAINTLLDDGSNYTAGIELVYNKTQPIAGLRHLMGPAIDYLYQPDKKLLPVMTSALYEDPNATPASIVAAIHESRVKFYVNNYRMHALPPALKNYLASEYRHYWGSIYLYAPVVHAGTRHVVLRFSGNYRVLASSSVKINDNMIMNNAIIHLGAGNIKTLASRDFRLALMPDKNIKGMQTAFQQDEWEKMIF